ncbi:MAG: hypothetical protein QOE36_1678 [Gaiellaceae bacterium]|nr:hypothetical protein [Gaiellaceae bacterium]
MRRSARVRRVVWRVFYEAVSLRRAKEPGRPPFINLGFEPAPGEARPQLRAEDEPRRLSIQLYDRVAGAVDLAGREVVEVGCGRGGGSTYVARYLGPRRVLGLDISRAELRRRRQEPSVPGLEFGMGDAEALPLADESFDAVLNVESSHCYGSEARFAAEASRVLRPGGHVLWADFGRPEPLDAMREAFLAAGLEVVEEEDLTPGVLRSLELGGSLGTELASWETSTSNGLRDGPFLYRRLQLRKP